MLHQSLNSAGIAQPNVLIQRSWERCARHGRELEDEPVLLDRADLNTRMDQYASLLQAATPQIQAALGLVTQAQGIVLLSDASGVILQSAGNNAFLNKADQVALRPGVSWAENLRGTNAIGTALIEKAFIRVHGQEHFLSRNRILSCHAAPIRSPRGEILGVLDISGDARNLPEFTGELVRIAASQICADILNGAPDHIARIQFQQEPGPLNSTSCGTLLVADGQIVGADERAVALLDTSYSALLDGPAEHWLPQWNQLHAEPAIAYTTDGMAFYATLQSERSLIGAGRSASSALSRNADADLAFPELARPSKTSSLGNSRESGNSHPSAATSEDARASNEAQELKNTFSKGRRTVQSVEDLPKLAPDVQDMLRQTTLAINADLGVLLLGETGTGKEVFARHLHARSRWADGPFVAINCAALPESLIEAELFGYESGAFTGAQRNGSKGRLRDANGGVLFLDEIGDMPLQLQSRLLRVLQERVVQPLGSDKTWPVQFGLISATNQDLHTLSSEEKFRQDLYYRIQDHQVQLPPLRTRTDLRAFICAELRRHENSPSLIFDDKTLDLLCAYHWPGNYRQLRSVLKTLAALLPAGSIIRPESLPQHVQFMLQIKPLMANESIGQTPDIGDSQTSYLSPSSLTPEWKAAATHARHNSAPDMSIKALQRQHIRQALEKNRGNVSKTARELGLHRSTVYRQLADKEPKIH